MRLLNLVDSQFCSRNMLMRFECWRKMVDTLFVCYFLRFTELHIVYCSPCSKALCCLQ